jgi:uncharacterized membrane protein YgcG
MSGGGVLSLVPPPGGYAAAPIFFAAEAFGASVVAALRAALSDADEAIDGGGSGELRAATFGARLAALLAADVVASPQHAALFASVQPSARLAAPPRVAPVDASGGPSNAPVTTDDGAAWAALAALSLACALASAGTPSEEGSGSAGHGSSMGGRGHGGSSSSGSGRPVLGRAVQAAVALLVYAAPAVDAATRSAPRNGRAADAARAAVRQLFLLDGGAGGSVQAEGEGPVAAAAAVVRFLRDQRVELDRLAPKCCRSQSCGGVGGSSNSSNSSPSAGGISSSSSGSSPAPTSTPARPSAADAVALAEGGPAACCSKKPRLQ